MLRAAAAVGWMMIASVASAAPCDKEKGAQKQSCHETVVSESELEVCDTGAPPELLSCEERSESAVVALRPSS